MSTVTNLLSKIDNSLAVNSIDSTACTQRIVCNTVRDAVKNAKTGEATSVDEFVLSFTRYPLCVIFGIKLLQFLYAGTRYLRTPHRPPSRRRWKPDMRTILTDAPLLTLINVPSIRTTY